MPKLQHAEEDDIVASGDALRTVAGWLGVADVDEVLEQEGLNPEFEMGRTQGLGLGAKYLPHHKAMAVLPGLEAKLGSKLKRSSKLRAAGAGMYAKRSKPTAPKRGFGTQYAHFLRQDDSTDQQDRQQQQRNGSATQDGGEEDDSADEGRGRAFDRGSKHALNKPAAFSRKDLLMGGPMPGGGAAHSRSKKKKKKRTQGVPDA